MEIKTVVTEFTERLQALIEGQVQERARAAVLQAFGRHPGRPGPRPKSAMALEAPTKKARKKSPLQLCPVPGCKNPAAPVFGMVCAKHKDIAKSKIKKYREARKAKKLGVPLPKKKKAPARRKKKSVVKKKPAAVVQTPAPAAAP